MLPVGDDHGSDPLWNDATRLLVHSWCILTAVHSWCPVDTSTDQLPHCVRYDHGLSSQDTQDGPTDLRHGLHDIGTLASAVRKLLGVGPRFHGESDGPNDEAVHDRLQLVRWRTIGERC